MLSPLGSASAGCTKDPLDGYRSFATQIGRQDTVPILGSQGFRQAGDGCFQDKRFQTAIIPATAWFAPIEDL
jgi:hypothetical protein